MHEFAAYLPHHMKKDVVGLGGLKFSKARIRRSLIERHFCLIRTKGSGKTRPPFKSPLRVGLWGIERCAGSLRFQSANPQALPTILADGAGLVSKI